MFFSWQARPNAPVLPQCERSASLQGKQSGCFDLLPRTVEQDLSQVYAYRSRMRPPPRARHEMTW